MIDLWNEPHSETDGDYVVFFGNIMGACSMVTIMRKDKTAEVVPHARCVMVAFIDVPIPDDDPRFVWHDNVNALEEKPFTEAWCVEQYNRHRWLALHKDGTDYHGSHDEGLILRHGIDNLNFTLSTPPECR